MLSFVRKSEACVPQGVALAMLAGVLGTIFFAKGGKTTKQQGDDKTGARRKKQTGFSEEGKKVNANDAFHLIKTRRSIFPKDYNGSKVPDKVISQMIEAANWAPTHGKTEPWRFVVLKEGAVGQLQAMMNEEALSMVQKGSDDYERLVKKIARKKKAKANVSHLIAICLKRVPSSKGKLMPEWEDISAVACAVQNMHLVAHASGVAGYWSSGGVDKSLAVERVKNYLGLTDERCLGLFHVGLSDRMDKYRSARSPFAGKVIQWLGDEEEKKGSGTTTTTTTLPSAKEEKKKPKDRLAVQFCKEVWTWANLVTAARYPLLVAGVLWSDERYVGISYALDIIDGPLARALNQCTQLGDILDHVADHITQLALLHMVRVYLPWWVMALGLFNNLLMLVYMAMYGHYIKHSKSPNKVLTMFMANNYHNIYNYMLFQGYIQMFVIIAMVRANGMTSMVISSSITFLVIIGILLETLFSGAMIRDIISN
eukprot:jgi/Bigna1/145176/aug1.96_g19884